MTDTKPPGVRWESWVERQIRDSMERGEFDNLSGAGKPLPTVALTDEAWWIREKLQRENASYLPPTLSIRKELEDALACVARAKSEAEVRSIVTAINERIVQINSRSTSGPPSSVVPVDVDKVLAQWRTARAEADDQTPTPHGRGTR